VPAIRRSSPCYPSSTPPCPTTISSPASPSPRTSASKSPASAGIGSGSRSSSTCSVAKRVRDRAVRWLRRHGYLDERAAEELRNEAAEASAFDGCTQLALAGGAFLARPLEPKENPGADLERKERRFSAACDGLDVKCAVRTAFAEASAEPVVLVDPTMISILHWGRLLERTEAPRSPSRGSRPRGEPSRPVRCASPAPAWS
jgi:hypothetical protein